MKSTLHTTKNAGGCKKTAGNLVIYDRTFRTNERTEIFYTLPISYVSICPALDFPARTLLTPIRFTTAAKLHRDPGIEAGAAHPNRIVPSSGSHINEYAPARGRGATQSCSSIGGNGHA
ncbi:hypothetical protein FTUN_5658 [Frigoriglobus tundricola]|uniref:Uncharacterized protein n=1 Tax=Frigoriglobus tundricola TaxID=2774151 RepID=A0A6M5YVX6_9BACT|nr:hypothetical protein FTUN_5658 [Frigoriglobus tundricola]